MGTEGSSPGVKLPVRKTDHSPPSIAEVNDCGAMPPLPILLHGMVQANHLYHLYLILCNDVDCKEANKFKKKLIKHSDNFTLPLLLPYIIVTAFIREPLYWSGHEPFMGKREMYTQFLW
jgi:hypothetical protein